jgi:hypothetical protein
LKILSEKDMTKQELGVRCGYGGNQGSIVNARLKAAIQLPQLIRMVNILGYEIVMQPIPKDPATRPAGQLVLDGEPSKQPIMKRGRGRPSKNSAQNKKAAPNEGQHDRDVTVKVESSYMDNDPIVKRLPDGSFVIKLSPVDTDSKPKEEAPAAPFLYDLDELLDDYPK